MTQADKLAKLKKMIGDTDAVGDEDLSVYLDAAGRKILAKAFPFDPGEVEVPDRYRVLQCEIAAYLWDKRGAEGQLTHNEGGIDRTYESADVPASMLRAVIPSCGVFK